MKIKNIPKQNPKPRKSIKLFKVVDDWTTLAEFDDYQSAREYVEKSGNGSYRIAIAM